MLVAMTGRDTARLAGYERRYRELAHELSEVGYIASGSVALRANRCGKANCACHDDPPRLHGPYWHFTAKVDGKTVNKLLSEDDARLYEEWIANDRKVRSLLTEMRSVAAKAQALMLTEKASAPARHRRRTASPETGKAVSRRSG
jgi:hypothetical protein